MRKLLTLALAAVAVVSVLPLANAAGGKQTVDGRVPLPAPFVDDSGCFAGAHRRYAIATQEAVGQSPIGYSFNIDKKTINKPFKLAVTGGQGSVDLDIFFYSQFGTVEDVVTDPGGAGAPSTVQFSSRTTDGEFGKVPPKVTRAIVCMMAGGANASFTYTAGKGVKK